MPKSYQALYRIWRPQSFRDVVDQQHVVRTLHNALKRDKLVHAYLFSGPRGTGKTSIARILAKAVNCEAPNDFEPCNKCKTCCAINDGNMLDCIEMDAASNRGVDEIRDLRDKVRYAPVDSKYTVYIIDEAHMLTIEAFNALLKVLEEPPKHVLFILATTELQKIPLTIVSRCQTFSFNFINLDAMKAHLRTIADSLKISITDEALAAIARTSEGVMRDAIGCLDQVIDSVGSGKTIDEAQVAQLMGSMPREIALQLLSFVLGSEPEKIISLLHQQLASGVEAERILQEIIFTCRDKMLEQLSSNLSLYAKVLDGLIHYQAKLRRAVHPQILLEVALLTLALPQPKIKAETESEKLDFLLERLKTLENRVETKLNSETTQGLTKQPSQENSQRQAPIGSRKLTKLVTSGERFTLAKQRWSEILAAVKQNKITAHAWLVEGEPVAVDNDRTLVIAYKSRIHCETIMKSTNREIVERVMAKLLPELKSIYAIMWDDWRALQHTEAQNESDLVKEAIDLFGEDLVEIK